ncbi:MAG: HD-GYP domain-containing protein [Lachnospiraceae bacterium]
MLPISVAVHQIKQGMIAADDVYSPSGQLVVPKNTIISPRIVSKLKLYNVKSLYVLIPESLANEIKREEPAPQNELRATNEFKAFKRNFVSTASELGSVLETLMQNPKTKINYQPLIHQVTSLTDNIHGTMHLMEVLQCMREYDDTVFVHSISVSLVARIIALRLNFSDKDMQELMLACLLHDIGKLKIPQEILQKPGRLTDEEYEQIKKHPQLGYALLKGSNLSDRVLASVLLHHERYDGSGYPSGITGDKTPLFARIIAIADVYDAMTAKRTYRKEICPFDVISMFEQEGYQKYDATLLLPFLKNIAQSYINAKVRLSNTLVGTIVMINEHRLSRPIINIDGQFHDLSKEADLTIESIL